MLNENDEEMPFHWGWGSCAPAGITPECAKRMKMRLASVRPMLKAIRLLSVSRSTMSRPIPTIISTIITPTPLKPGRPGWLKVAKKAPKKQPDCNRRAGAPHQVKISRTGSAGGSSILSA